MAKYILRPELLNALIAQESGWNPGAVSNKGAFGLGQAMPGTAENPGYGVKPLKNKYDPAEQIRFARDYATALLNQPDINGNEALMLAAYNAGHGSVKKYKGIPPYKETQNYVAKIASALNPIGSAYAEGIDQPEIQGTDREIQKRQERLLELKKSLSSPSVSDDIPPNPRLERLAALKKELTQQPGVAEQILKGVGSKGLEMMSGIAGEFGLDNISESFKKGADFTKRGVSGAAYDVSRIATGMAPGMAVPGGFLAQLAAQPALAHALQPGTEEERQNAATQAAIGTIIGGGIGSAISKGITGFTPSKIGKELLDEGVVPTVGQGVDKSSIPGKFIAKTEQSLTSLPIIGDIINHARNRSGGEVLASKFAKNVGIQPMKMGNRTIEIKPVGDNMNEMLSSAITQKNMAYEKALKGTRVDISSIKTDLINLVNNSKKGIDALSKKSVANKIDGFDQVLKDAKTYDPKTGTIDASELKIMSSDIMNEAMDYFRSPIKSEKNVGEVYKDVAFALKKHRQNFMSPEQIKAEEAIDKSYGAIKMFEDASSSARAQLNSGNPTPRELMGAVKKQATKTGSKSKFASGQMSFQKDIEQIDEILGNVLPNSYTTDRLITSGLGGLAITGSLPIAPQVAIPAIAGTGLAYAGSSRPVQKYLLGGYNFQANQGKYIADLIERLKYGLGAGVANQ